MAEHAVQVRRAVDREVEKLRDVYGVHLERTRAQIEEDADREIEVLKAELEATVQETRETNLRLKGENGVRPAAPCLCTVCHACTVVPPPSAVAAWVGIMRKKFTALQKDIEHQKDEISGLFQNKKALHEHILSLERDILGLKKEIRERDETIGYKVMCIYSLEKKNQELEKFLFVLFYKMLELKKLLAPRLSLEVLARVGTAELKRSLETKQRVTPRASQGRGVKKGRGANGQERVRAASQGNGVKGQEHDPAECHVLDESIPTAVILGGVIHTRQDESHVTVMHQTRIIEDSERKLLQLQKLREADRREGRRELMRVNGLLMNAQDQIAGMTSRLKLLNSQMTAMRNEIDSKNQALVREHLERTRTAVTTEKLRQHIRNLLNPPHSGPGAWPVLPAGVIRQDRPTRNQLTLIEMRNRRWGPSGQMPERARERRRARLARAQGDPPAGPLLSLFQAKPTEAEPAEPTEPTDIFAGGEQADIGAEGLAKEARAATDSAVVAGSALETTTTLRLPGRVRRSAFVGWAEPGAPCPCERLFASWAVPSWATSPDTGACTHLFETGEASDGTSKGVAMAAGGSLTMNFDETAPGIAAPQSDVWVEQEAADRSSMGKSSGEEADRSEVTLQAMSEVTPEVTLEGSINVKSNGGGTVQMSTPTHAQPSEAASTATSIERALRMELAATKEQLAAACEQRETTADEAAALRGELATLQEALTRAAARVPDANGVPQIAMQPPLTSEHGQQVRSNS